jgi:predicted metal-dependent hydrolase
MIDETFRRGARLFDAGAFFDAHEAWEERWRVETDPETRRFLHGLATELTASSPTCAA